MNSAEGAVCCSRNLEDKGPGVIEGLGDVVGDISSILSLNFGVGGGVRVLVTGEEVAGEMDSTPAMAMVAVLPPSSMHIQVVIKILQRVVTGAAVGDFVCGGSSVK